MQSQIKIAHVLVWLGGAREKNWESRISELLAQRGHSVVRVPYPRWPKPYHEFDLVYASHHMAAPLAAMLARREHAKLVLQALDVPEFRLAGKEPWASNLERYLGISLESYKREWAEVGDALLQADAVTSISRTTARAVESRWGIESEVNPLGVDRAEADRWLGGPQRRNQFCALGNLYDHKRFDLLVRVFNGLRRKFVLMGDGYMRGELERIAGPQVVLTGSVTEQQKFRVFARSNALVHSSVCEGQPLLFAEALYAGTPVVAYDLPVIRESYPGAPIWLWREEPELTKGLEGCSGCDHEEARQWVLEHGLTLQAHVDRLNRLLPSLL